MSWRSTALAGIVVAGCAGAPEAPEGFTDPELEQLARLRLDPRPRPDPTNRFADDPAAAALGQALFFDEGLSPVGVSCATCHDPSLHFTDGKVLSEGAGTATRHTPSIVGSQWGQWFFWDGRADSLWAQALGPLENPLEMAGDRVSVVQHVLRRHGDAYAAAFGPPPDLGLPEQGAGGGPFRARPGADAPDLDAAWRALDDETRMAVDRVFAQVGKAIAAYERLLVPGEAPFDRYVDALLAGDADGGGHLDDGQVRGLELFLRRGNCVDCHSGPMFTDRAFHNLGLPEKQGYDQGRTRGAMLVQASPFNCRGPHSDAEDCPELRYLNPTFPDFVSAFKTPSLRNVLQTAPYMHHGGFATIADVLEFYSELPGEPLAGHRELTLKPLRLTPGERADLTQFLGALTGDPLPGALLEPPGAAVAQETGASGGASYEGE